MKAEIEQALATASTVARTSDRRLTREISNQFASALAVIRAEMDELTGALAAGDERLIAAAERAGVAYTGCDTPDALAEKIEEQGAEIERLKQDDIKFTYCACCGYTIAVDSDEDIVEHIKVCDKHPMREVEGQLAAIREALSAALGVDGSAEELATLAGKAIPELVDALNRIDNWLVCYAITTPEDMMQAVPEMHEIARAAIEAAKGGGQ